MVVLSGLWRLLILNGMWTMHAIAAMVMFEDILSISEQQRQN